MSTDTDKIAVHRGLKGVYFDRSPVCYIDGRAGERDRLLEREQIVGVAVADLLLGRVPDVLDAVEGGLVSVGFDDAFVKSSHQRVELDEQIAERSIRSDRRKRGRGHRRRGRGRRVDVGLAACSEDERAEHDRRTDAGAPGGGCHGATRIRSLANEPTPT